MSKYVVKFEDVGVGISREYTCESSTATYALIKSEEVLKIKNWLDVSGRKITIKKIN